MTRRSLSRRNFLTGSTAGVAALHPFAQRALASSSSRFDTTPASLEATHDLPSLSRWGPYSKKFYGISHIPDLATGLLFDLSIFPTLEGAPVQLPNVTDRCGVHPWSSAPDLTYYTTRTELLWKDQVYCEHAYIDAGAGSRLIRVELVNNTSAPQRIQLQGLSQLCFPPLHELTAQPIRLCDISLPSSALWADALSYEEMRFAVPRPTDNLVTDGRWRGEERMHDSVGGSVLAQGFGRDSGDNVLYTCTTKRPFAHAVIILRFLIEADLAVTLHCSGLVQQDVTLCGSGEFATAMVEVGPLNTGKHVLRLVSGGGAALALNGFAVAERKDVAAIAFTPRPWHPQPAVETEPNGGLLLKYNDLSAWYGFTLGQPAAKPQFVLWRDLDRRFGAHSCPDTQNRIVGHGRDRPGDPDSLFVQVCWPAIDLPSASRHVLVGLVCTGTEKQVRAQLRGFKPAPAAYEERATNAAASAVMLHSNPQGRTYLPGQQLLAATTLSNVVYPLRTQRQTIRNYSPGKIWDCLYTWDAGFIGLGLLELDTNAALEALNAYLTPAGTQSAFIHHGTPLPTQIYLFVEIFSRTPSPALLRSFYPRMRQYYLFLVGRLGSSTMRTHRNGLICTWDYFYNSGGWDDYPAQAYLHKNKLEATTAPAVSTSHVIRCAKLLRLMAREAGAQKDIALYDGDIQQLSGALQRDAWDPGSGYFGYVTYSSHDIPDGILRTTTGVNFNMGLDGVSPLIAGVCSTAQQRTLLEKLFSEDHLWTDAGITTVDKQAPYYSPDGYWNGSVWFAHQWFLFKTMLDLGRGDLAVKIARTGVETWHKSTGATYDCMEHFSSRPPYAAGWCQFSSLSSPALSWFSALFTPGRVTVGFDTLIRHQSFYAKANQVSVLLAPAMQVGPTAEALICLRPAQHYDVRCDGHRATFSEILPGLLRVLLPHGTRSVEARGTASSAG
jgi:hypothetical protein